MIDKNVLRQYEDACKLVEETEQEIRELNKRKETIIQTKVKGSMAEFPYIEKSFPVEGMVFTYTDQTALEREEKILHERKQDAERIKQRVEEFINSAPPRMQRIIKFRYIQKMQWNRVAKKMGGRCTGESIRKELDNYLKEK